VISKRASRLRRLASFVGGSLLFLVASSSVLVVLFIFIFIIKDAVPFFAQCGFGEFFTSTAWYPSNEDAQFGALAIFYGSAMVTVGAVAVATPLGILAAVCLSDILPFALRQVTKPIIELLAAIPSVAFGFFALVVLAPQLQENGGAILSLTSWIVGAPIVLLVVLVISDLLAIRLPRGMRIAGRVTLFVVLGALGCWALSGLADRLSEITINSGTNALNVSIILGIMALPTVVSVSEDSLQAVGRELREGSYALGATRAETMIRVVIPAAANGICAAVILGIMRAYGETMVVWMASGNAAKIPEPWYNLLEPVRTLTATIAGDMGEADHVTGSARYHVLFAMALALLTVSFVFNLISERIAQRAVRVGNK
jgi:phosphate transport system permease protein